MTRKARPVRWLGRRLRPPSRSTTPRWLTPPSQKAVRILPSERKPKVVGPKIHNGTPKSASISRIGLATLAIEAMQVPPPAPVGGEDDAPIRRPLRLEDGFIGATGDLRDIDEPCAVDRPRFEDGPVPGHVGVIPFQPEELRAIRGGPRRGVEIPAGDQDLDLPGVRIDPDDLVHRLAVTVALPDTDDAPIGEEPPVGVPQCTRRARARV